MGQPVVYRSAISNDFQFQAARRRFRTDEMIVAHENSLSTSKIYFRVGETTGSKRFQEGDQVLFLPGAEMACIVRIVVFYQFFERIGRSVMEIRGARRQSMQVGNLKLADVRELARDDS